MITWLPVSVITLASPVIRASTLLVAVILLAACQVGPIKPGPENSAGSTVPRKPHTVESGVVNSSPSQDPARTQLLPNKQEKAIVYQDLWQRMADHLVLYQQYEHASIEAELEWFAGNQRYIDQVTEQAAPFLYEIVEAVEQRDLPLDLALLPVIESAFNPRAYSSEHAAGLWQFMPRTARSYGLKADWWYDGRRDPLASTRAALDYLEFLRDEFDGNWLLALAGYNAGEGNVRRAVRRSGATNETVDFWSLRLPLETRGHVPRLLAFARLIANAEDYGVSLPVLPNEPYLEIVNLDFQMDLSLAARLAGLEEEQLRALNAGYLQWATHPDSPQFVVLPRERAERFRSAVTQLPAEQRVSWDRYQIRRGDTLGAIARRFGTRADVLQTVNNLSGSRIIAGRSLLIPRADSSVATSLSSPLLSRPATDRPTPTSYRVVSGDSLWRIARRFDLQAADIAEWNHITLDSLLHPGQILALQPGELSATGARIQDGKIEYTVVRGDSLARIARRFKVSIADIVAWNELDPAALIFPGQRIVLQPAEAVSNQRSL